MTTIETKTTLNLIDCCECGAQIALTSNFERSLRDDHRTFYCPSGHYQNFPAKNEAEKLREALHSAELETTRLAQQVKKAQIEKDAAEKETARLKMRAVAGLCPCCNRTFLQLARHMKSKHPGHGAA